MSPLALQAKKVIEAAWLHGAAYDLASQAAFALESAQLLQSPETAAQSAVSAKAVQLAEDSVAELRREHEENARLRERIAELEQQASLVSEFVAARAEYITAIRNCHPDNGHDYDRWQGHAAARRQLAEVLALPVAWPPEDSASVKKSADKLARLLEDPHDGPLAHTYRLGRDLPEMGSV